MRRLLVIALLAFSAAGSAGSAQAVCAGTLLCAGTGCSGTVNVCPTAQSCSGGVSICPMAKPWNCHSSVDVCTGLVGPVLACQDIPQEVCGLLAPR